MLQLSPEWAGALTRLARALGLLAGLAALAPPAGAQDSSVVRTGRVTYVTSASVYIDAGRDAGLREGGSVQVIRGGAVIGVLKVAFLASRQASCDIVSESAPIAVGDSVRFTAAAPRADSATAVARSALPRPPSPARAALRGRVGAHYLVVGQAAGGGFTQPSVDFRLDGRPFGDGSVGVTVDVRARRTSSSLAGGGTAIDGHARAYQLALFWNPPTSPTRITVGRQFAPGLAAVGMFDGILIELNKPAWGAGVFTGSQPEPLNLGFATDVVELGGYVQRRNRAGADRQWSATLGASGSYQNAHANREFAFLQGSFVSRRVSALVAQEVDYYRWWKRTPGTAAVSLTSTFATVRYRTSALVDVHVGFDNRRNVLLYRDVVNPLTTFDDAFRQGVWAGMGVRLGRRYRIGIDARESSGGPAGRANSYTLSLGGDRLTPLGLSARTRSTYYRNRQLDGWLHSASLGFEAANRLHLEVSGGGRIERDPLADPASRTITWLGADLDVNLARAWYLMASGSWERGVPESSNQIYAGFSVRF